MTLQGMDISIKISKNINPSGTCLFKVDDGSTRTKSKICLKLTTKTLAGASGSIVLTEQLEQVFE